MWTSKAYPMIILLLFVLVIYPACSKSDDVAQVPPIVGTWSWDNGMRTEYRADGTFVHPWGWIGSWEIKGDSLTVKQPPETYLTYKIVEMSSNRLVIIRLSNNREFIGERVE